MKNYILFFFLLISCKEKYPNSTPYFLKNKADNYSLSKFYKDFDIFNRKGIEQLLQDTLYFPFFQVNDLNDSTLELILFATEKRTEHKIPKDNRTTYRFYDITDGPRHVYTKIYEDRIVSYGYGNTLTELKNSGTNNIYLSEVVPSEITIMKSDSVLSFYFGQCLDLQGIDIDEFQVSKTDIDKYWIEPFTAYLKCGCRDKVSFFDIAGNQKEYFESINGEKRNPRIIGKREFQYWRLYYGEFY